MPKAFILISAEVGGEDEILNELKRIEQIIEAYKLYGVYDLIAILETKDMDELNRIVWNSIRRLDKVRSTVTMVTVR
ncbi:MAG: Lrp/AsnC ligand binding domain-containing protein [Candidatus Bathyarchaeia archaeon]